MTDRVRMALVSGSAPLHLHPGDLGWHSLRGAAVSWGVADEVVQLLENEVETDRNAQIAVRDWRSINAAHLVVIQDACK